jgi:hypothetical protein
MNLYSKFQEKIIFSETPTPMFFYHEVDPNLSTNYEFKNGIPVFRKNITQTFANNTFANMICFEKIEKIDYIINDNLNKICENDSNKIRKTIFKMKEALYEGIELPILLKIFNTKNSFKTQLFEFERVTSKILNEVEHKTNSNNLTNDNEIIEVHFNNLLEKIKISNQILLNELPINKNDVVDLPIIGSKERRSAKNFDTLSLEVKTKIIKCHELDLLLMANGIPIDKVRLNGRIKIAEKLNLDITNRKILIEIIDRGSFYQDFLSKKILDRQNKELSTQKKELWKFEILKDLKEFISK